ncbi:hypothetical protein C8039_01745 [Halogeometricum sp. wsp3]|nr:hypothetical protein C8039_01745 [Halogeometricum sp. wsp3]
MRVLHVDDDAAFAELVAIYLERERDHSPSHRDVRRRCTGDASDIQVDCVVSDYDMPQKDGLDFLELVRHDYPDLPFIL